MSSGSTRSVLPFSVTFGPKFETTGGADELRFVRGVGRFDVFLGTERPINPLTLLHYECLVVGRNVVTPCRGLLTTDGGEVEQKGALEGGHRSVTEVVGLHFDLTGESR